MWYLSIYDRLKEVLELNKTKLWTANFIFITLINFFMFFAFQLFPSALPPYLKSLGASDRVLGWLQGILTIATLLARPFAGIALDRYGRKGIFFIGLICMILSTAAYLFFPVVGIILMIRFTHGLGWGIANTACGTVASDNIQKIRFAEGMGYFSLASSMAMAIAPAAALALGMHNNIRLALALLALSFVILTIMKVQMPSKALTADNGKNTPYAKESVLPSVIMLLITITWGAVVTFLALYGKEKSIANVGLFFTVYAVSMLSTRPFLGKLIDHKGYGAGIWPGIVLIPAALLLLSVSSNLTLFLVSAVFYGIGIGAVQSSLQTMAIVNVPSNRTGAGNATFFTGFDGGIGIGAVLAGLLSSAMGYGRMFAFMSIFPVLGGILYLATVKRCNIKSV